MIFTTIGHQQLVHQHVVYEVFLCTLQSDQQKMTRFSLKFRDVYHGWLKRLEEHAIQQKEFVERELEQYGVRILATRLKLGYREVRYLHQDATYTDKLLNEWLKKECEQLFCSYTYLM
ncbi:hypothetical protein SAMN04487866_10854 [Thermoactinomyces sp. DSM 45891]|uniref:hypothetical protein n=1 Tax=Thermoactinomyces sp. DSM 45891 TaxID=1761907 RepID=UPI00091BFC77|nr:hypothetical protein [Thermoactinomyces sp. DSM 45891]SFX45177.1 hypothetical protein SAMN04487866_10854 [Thermoactinomyces sp. DSM 45891]